MKDTRRKDQLEEEAYHEAGHYAAVLVLPDRYPGDFPVKAIHKISLVREGDSGGHVEFALDAGSDNIPRAVSARCPLASGGRHDLL